MLLLLIDVASKDLLVHVFLALFTVQRKISAIGNTRKVQLQHDMIETFNYKLPIIVAI